MTFVDKEGRDWTFEVADGDNLLDIAQANDLEMEGACGGSCACSTCHVIVADDAMYDKMVRVDDDFRTASGQAVTKDEGKVADDIHRKNLQTTKTTCWISLLV